MPPSAHRAGGGRRPAFTRDEIIERLQRWAALFGEPPVTADWNPSVARWRAQEWRVARYRAGDPGDGSQPPTPWPSLNAAKQPFGGSFDAAVRAAGLEPRPPGPRRPAGHALPGGARGPLTELDARLQEAEQRVRAAERHAVRAARRAERAEGLVAEARGRARRAGDRARRARASRERLAEAEADARMALAERAEAAIAQARAAQAAAERRALAAEARATAAAQGRGATARAAATAPSSPPAELPIGPAVLAAALRDLARARTVGDRLALAGALGDVAAAAERWRARL